MTSDSCSGTRACHSISNSVLNIVMALLREHAVDGKLNLTDVERILTLIGRGTVSLDEAYRLQEERCRKDHSRPKGNVGARSNPFQRLVVRPFESLLAGASPAFPRPLLANYFEFIEHAMGNEREAFERDCRAIIQALLVVHGNNLTWDHFYSDARTLKALHGALKRITHVLSTPEGQKAWHSLLTRPVDTTPAPTIAQTNQLRQALLETHRGLSVG
ncbi:MAG: hypothetical protein H7Z12_10480 [Rhodospirillaceae bacterium]|nr:hypothetical protein [Rhodospirillales bacterium]